MILLIIACGIIGYEAVYSTLAYHLKKLLLIHKIRPVLELLSSFKVHKQLAGKFKLLLVVSMLVIPVAGFLNYILQLIECPYCTSFHIGLWLSLLAFNLPVLVAILIGACAMGSCALYNLIRLKAI